jgi:hypothetical protein
VRLSLRQVLSLAGQQEEAQSLVVESIQLSEVKGFTVGAERARNSSFLPGERRLLADTSRSYLCGPAR